jgi:hypothetical protein
MVVAQADHAERIRRIAEAANVDVQKASRMYVLKAIKQTMRSIGCSYSKALESYEDRQVGDRNYQPIPTKRQMEIHRIEDAGHGPVRRTRPGYLVTPEGIAVPCTYRLPDMHDTTPDRGGPHTYLRRIAGELAILRDEVRHGYTGSYEDTERRARTQADREARLDDILADHLAAYVESRSETVQARIAELLEAPYSAAYIMSAIGAKDARVTRLRAVLKRMHATWRHKAAISAREMLTLMRKYLEVVPDNRPNREGRPEQD